MRKSFLLLMFGVVACNSVDENCDPETLLTSTELQKEIFVTYNSEFQRNEYIVNDGDNRIFEFNRSGPQCDDIIDDEWGEILTFQLANEEPEFEFIDSDISNTNCFYQQYGAWVRHNQYTVENGVIRGKKLSNNEWEITVSVTTTPLFENEEAQKIEFVEIFRE